MGPLKYSDGSAEWRAQSSLRNIKFVCSVNGPLEVQVSNEDPQMATIELVYRPNDDVSSIREELIQEVLNNCLLSVVRRDLIPQSLLQVVVQLLDISQYPAELKFIAELSEAINCMTVALTNNGVPMSGLVVAVGYGVDDSGKVWSALEFPQGATVQSSHVIAFKYKDGVIQSPVVVESSGQFKPDLLLSILDAAQTDAEEVVQKQKSLIQGG